MSMFDDYFKVRQDLIEKINNGGTTVLHDMRNYFWRIVDDEVHYGHSVESVFGDYYEVGSYYYSDIHSDFITLLDGCTIVFIFGERHAGEYLGVFRNDKKVD